MFHSPAISSSEGQLGFRRTPLPAQRQHILSHQRCLMLDGRASLLSAAPMLLTKTALYLPRLCSTSLLHPTPELLLSADFGGQGVPHCWGNGGGFLGPTAVWGMCPSGNLLSGNQLVLLCFSLELCFWQLGSSNLVSALWQAPSHNQDVLNMGMS